MKVPSLPWIVESRWPLASHDASHARAASTSPAGAGAAAGCGLWVGRGSAWAAPAARANTTASAAIMRTLELMESLSSPADPPRSLHGRGDPPPTWEEYG